MKVGFALDGFPNTTETFIQNQIIGLIDNEIDVTVFAEKSPDDIVEHSTLEGYNLYSSVIYTGNPESYLDGVQLLYSSIPSLLKKREISWQTVLSELKSGISAPRRLSNIDTITEHEILDIYHAHFGPVGNRYLGVTECYSSPFVVSFYGQDASQLLQDDPHLYDRLFRQATVVTALSNDMRDTLTDYGCPPSKIQIQPLSIDTDLFPYREHTPSDGPIKLLTVARFVEKKGLVYALEAVANLAEEHDIRYTIVGDGERRELIESRIARHGLGDIVDLRGWQPQSVVAEEMANAHLFLLPSVTAESGDKEGTPTVLLEAQSMGLPVVSTYHAGIPEIVKDGESGVLVPERDSEALADALETLISEPNRWPEMGKRGREHIERSHSIEAVTDDLLKLYRSLL